jgi:hypothetical protein
MADIKTLIQLIIDTYQIDASVEDVLSLCSPICKATLKSGKNSGKRCSLKSAANCNGMCKRHFTLSEKSKSSDSDSGSDSSKKKKAVKTEKTKCPFIFMKGKKKDQQCSLNAGESGFCHHHTNSIPIECALQSGSEESINDSDSN